MTGTPPPARILVCRTDALGDALLSLPVCTSLRRGYPKAHIVWLVSEYVHNLLNGQAGPDEVWSYDASGEHAGPAGWNRLRRRLRQARFDCALMVYPDRRVSTAVWAAGIPRRIGTGRRWWSFLYSQPIQHSRQAAERHEADYNLDLVRALGITPELEPPKLRLEPEASRWAYAYLSAWVSFAHERLVIVHPGSRGSAANWPAGTYRDLVQGLLKRKGVRVLLTGSAAEQPLLDEIARHCTPAPLRLDAPVDLPRLAALISLASVFFSSNTGPMHVAAALGVPTVSLFPATGVTGPARWRPLGNLQVLLMPPHRPGTDPSEVRAITPEEAVQAVAEVLVSVPAPWRTRAVGKIQKGRKRP